MFLGHFAVAFAAKKVNSQPSLGTYFFAAQFLDLLWPTLLLFKLEKVKINTVDKNQLPLIFTSYPISHSLLMVLIWGIIVWLIYKLVSNDARAALVVAFCVVSHWILDLIVHVPDLPLYPGNSPLVGLGLWKYMSIELILESLMFVIAAYIYAKATRARNKAGLISFWTLLIFLFAIQVANAFGPPPPSINAVAWAGQLQWLFVFWAYYTDKNRVTADKERATTFNKSAFG